MCKDEMVRRVLAGYSGEVDQTSPDQGKSWLDYVRTKNKGTGKVPSAVKDMLKDKETLGEPFDIYNPYDFQSPTDKPKDIGDSPVFVSEPFESGYGIFNAPDSLYDEGSSLEQWYKSRRIDHTQNEEEQSPALSITRKYSSEDFPLVVKEYDLDDLMRTSKLAASVNEIVNKDYHYKNQAKQVRAGKCFVRWINEKNRSQREKGLFIFDVKSMGSSNVRRVYFQFLRGDDAKIYNTYADYPVQMACTCPSFLWHGAQYYAVRDKYMYMPMFRPDLVAPLHQDMYVEHASQRYPDGKKHPGRGLNFRVCKHILAAYRVLRTMKIEKHFRKYPVTSPPSKVMNRDVWKNLMKFEFTEANIKQRLKSSSPKIPAYFRREDITPAVIDWFNDVWIPRSDEDKIKALRTMVGYPERIFFILLKEAYLKRKQGDRISDRLVNEGFDLMDRVVQEDNEQDPKAAPGVPDKYISKGTGPISEEQGNIPAEDFIKGAVKHVGDMKKDKSVNTQGVTQSVDNKTKPLGDKRFQ